MTEAGPPLNPRRRPGRPPGPSQAAQLRARLVDEASKLYAAGGGPYAAGQ